MIDTDQQTMTQGGQNRRFLYAQLADELEQMILSGVYRPGDRLPSIRQLQSERGVALVTVTRALSELEARDVVESRPRSGYYVRPARVQVPQPELKRHRMRAKKVPLPLLADDFVTASAKSDWIPLGGAVVAPQLLPLKHLSRLVRQVARKSERTLATYGPPAGAPELRRAIAKRMLKLGRPTSVDEVVVTAGCMSAIQLALLAVTKPGDTVVLESPTFFGFLQLVRDLGLLALEVPTDPGSGIDLESLESALKSHSPKALLVTPNYQNPTGALIPDDNKKRIIDLCRRRRVTIVEDDIYGDLHFGPERPRSLLSLAGPEPDLIYCSSVSKTLTPGLRVGWMVPGKHLDRVKRLKLSGAITSPPLNQLVVAEFLASGAYLRHLSRLTAQLKTQVMQARDALALHLPPETEVTSPEGGFLLWVRLPRKVDSLDLYEQMKRKKISVLPGPLCASDKKFGNYLRISAGHPFSKRHQAAVRAIGRIAFDLGA